MKLNINIILYSLLGIVLVCAVALGIAGNRSALDRKKCCGISVTVIDSTQNKFIGSRDVKRFIDKEFGGYRNRYCSDVDLRKLENTLEGMGCLKRHDAYFDSRGKLNVVVCQMTPVIKFQSAGQMYYVDSEGKSFRVKDDWCNSCMEIMGCAFPQKDGWSRQVAGMASYLRKDKMWKNREIRVTSLENGEMELGIDSLPEHFILGHPTLIREKMGKIAIYEKSILPTLDSDKQYKTVTLKYKGQIVCR